MKKRLVISAICLALIILIIIPIAVMAAGDVGPAVSPALNGSLAIVAPWAGAAGAELSLAVFLRSNQEPVAGAGIWLLTRENADSVKQDIQQQKGKPADMDFTQTVAAAGTQIGVTGENGKLTFSINETGTYVLVAVKAGYFPDFSVLNIGFLPGSLGINAPDRVSPGEKFTIEVFQKNTMESVKDAGVWAFSREKAETLKTRLSELRAGGQLSESDLEASLNMDGILLGSTNGDGKLQASITDDGGYLLVAYKPGSRPAFKGIVVKNAILALGIDSPNRANPGDTVEIDVFQRGTSDPVKDAGVWAFTREQAQVLKAELESLKSGQTPLSEIDWEAMVSVNGKLLGTTNGDGKLKTSFDTAGGYLLVTVKSGYLPAYKGIGILAPAPAANRATPRGNR